jgi:hypothetical protein
MDETKKEPTATTQEELPVVNRPVVDRFLHIKEMIELPEENVSATREPRELKDRGLPTGLLMIIAIAIVAIAVMAAIYFGVANNTVQITLGTHFTK